MRYFNLFSNIFITKGVNRILISDLQREVSELYPMEFYELIEELKSHSIENILQKYDIGSQEIVGEYIDFMLEKEYGFITENDWDYSFPPLSYEFYGNNIISDIFIELENIDILNKIRSSIENLGIRHLVVFSENKFSFDDFFEIDQIFKNTSLENIEIFSPFHNNIDYNFIRKLNEKTFRIHNLVFYNCKQPFKVKDEYRFAVNFSDQNLKISSCGKVDLKYFNTNLPKIMEAINHNSCLHKKIGIDIDGNIKNCPLMPGNFGNIHKSSLEEAILQPGLKKYWNLTKDHIEVCKDCEFRYICTDCRAYTERTHSGKNGLDISKPLKCGYDPYTGEWDEWSKNPLKQKAIQYYSKI